jgi:PPP family 3-phenylpropionic acid transporter
MNVVVSSPGAGLDDVTRRRVLRGLTLTYALHFASMGLQLPFSALAMSHAGAGPAVIGAMWTARSLTGAVVPVVWGVLADRLGNARGLVLASLVMGALVMGALGFASTATAAIALFGLYGLVGTAAGSLIDGMVLSALAKDAHRYGRYRVFGSIGFGVAAVVASVLLERGAVEPAPSTLFPVCGALSLLAALVVWLWVPPLPRPPTASLGQLGHALRQPTLWWLILAASSLWASHAGYVSFLAPLAADAGLPTSAIGTAVGAAIVCEVITMPLVGAALSRVRAGPLLLACALVAVARWVALTQATSSTSWALLHSLHGITFGVFFVVVVGALAARTPPELRHASQGLLTSLSLGFGGGIGGAIVGGLLEQGLPASAIWWAMAALATVTTAALVPVVTRLR